MSYKTTDGLMRHLRSNGIDISGPQKRQLRNTGYYHGYKGYRFMGKSVHRLPFSSYKEIYATIQYDSDLKALFYPKIMFIETAIKNIALEGILVKANSETIQSMYDKTVSGYHNAPVGATVEQKRKLQQNKLNLQNSIQNRLAKEYRRNNPVITHFYNGRNTDVPIWALFEILMMGDFGYLLSCLTYDVRDDISKRIGLNLSCDTERELVYKYIYILKDLRNAIAHNSVVFDARFREIDPSKAMKTCLVNEIGVSYINFKTIGDYVILMCYFMKILGTTKTEIKAFLREYEKLTNEYRNSVDTSVANMVIHPDLAARMSILKNYI